ncbi:MAG: hypothetical protein J6Y25_06735 [Elusimicrobiaceae bacterium]|nr:hypothetical protein [Elusimicrobiaceae bacterium]
MSEVAKTVFTWVGNIGGISVIMWAIINKLLDMLADRVAKQNEQTIAKEIAKYQSALDRQIYISQKHFDLKLSIYKDLIGVVMDMTQTTYMLFPPADELPADPNEEKKVWLQRYKDAVQRYNASADILYKNAPFIEEKIYNHVAKLRTKCSVQIHCFVSYRLETDNYERLEKGLYNDVSKRTQEIIKMRDGLVKDIRDILNKLQAQVQ